MDNDVVQESEYSHEYIEEKKEIKPRVLFYNGVDKREADSPEQSRYGRKVYNRAMELLVIKGRAIYRKHADTRDDDEKSQKLWNLYIKSKKNKADGQCDQWITVRERRRDAEGTDGKCLYRRYECYRKKRRDSGYDVKRVTYWYGYALPKYDGQIYDYPYALHKEIQ